MDQYINYLAEAEGKEVHYNKGEKNITMPYGIYAHYHMDSDMFELISGFAYQARIYKDSKKWTTADIASINIYVEMHHDEVIDAAKDFYRTQIALSGQNYIPKEAQLAFFSMYTHSPLKAWKAVQQSILDLISQDNIGLLKSEASMVDGAFGAKTRKALEYIEAKKDNALNYLLEAIMIINMIDQYGKDDHANLIGFINRVKIFKSIK